MAFYVFNSAPLTAQPNDWDGIQLDKDDQGRITEMNLNWTRFTSVSDFNANPSGGNRLINQLFANDPLPTVFDDVVIEAANGSLTYQVTINGPDFWGNMPAADSVFIATGSSLTVNAGGNALTLGAGLGMNGTALTNNGAVTINSTSQGAPTAVAVGGNISNFGFITLHTIGGGWGSLLSLTNDVTLKGGGQVVLSLGASDANRDEITGSSTTFATTLHNFDNTISGAGTIGSGNVVTDPGNKLILDNQAAGVVIASNAATALTVNTVSIANAGVLSAIGGATLKLLNTAITQSGSGKIISDGIGSTVLFSGVTLKGGLLTTANGGLLTDDQATAVTFDGSTAAGPVTFATNYLVGSSGQGNPLSATVGVTFNGAIINNGVVTLHDVGGDWQSAIKIGASDVTLTGAGQIVMQTVTGDANRNEITGSSATSATLHNVDNKISGAGTIGADGTVADPQFKLILDNQSAGVVNASNKNAPLIINAASVTNVGVLEATAGATLNLTNTTINQSATGNFGVIGATGIGSKVVFSGVTLQGGLLTTADGGVLTNDQSTGVIFDGSTPAGAVTFLTDYLVGTSGQGNPVSTTNGVTLNGAIINDGVITVHDVGGDWQSAIKIGASGVTLTGGGQIAMQTSTGDASRNEITGWSAANATTLHNVNNTISGAGTIGFGGTIADPGFRLVLDNQASGVINANNAASSLTLNMTDAVSNAGTIEATATGGLLVKSTTIIQSGAGNVVANGAGATVTLSGAAIEGGRLAASNGGLLTNDLANGVTTLDGHSAAGAITIAGNFLVATSGQGNPISTTNDLVLDGQIINNGVITLHASGGDWQSAIKIGADGVALTGGGQIAMQTSTGDSNRNEITGSSMTVATTLHNVNNTISGAGTIGFGGTIADPGFRLVLDNQAGGVINANNAASSFTLNMTDAVSNAGTIESTAAGGLNILSTTVIQSGAGKIVANGAGATVTFSGATIEGGLLAASNGGLLKNDLANGGATIDGHSAAGAVTIAGNFLVATSGQGNPISATNDLILDGSIINNGVITLHAAGGDWQSAIKIGADGVTLTGGGQIAMQTETGDSNRNEITGSSANAVTLHNVNNTISGAGTIGYGGTVADPGYQLILDNQAAGVVNASSDVAQLVIATGTPMVANTGLIEATGAAGLLVNNSTINNTGGGRMLAADGSHIDLVASGILLGTLQSTGTGYFQASDPFSVIAGVTTSATIKIGAGKALSMGDISNTGNVLIDGTSGTATLNAEGAWTGGGHISLTNAPASTLNMNGTWSSDNIISGAGMFSGTGGAGVAFTNTGTVDAIYAANALTIATGQTLTNNGTFKADSGKLIVNDAVTGSGTAIVTNGGTLDFTANFQENVSFQGSNAGTLLLSQAYGGVISGFGKGDTIDFAGFSYATGDHVVLQSSVGGIETFGVETSGNAVVTMFHVSGSQPASAFEVQTNANHDLLLSYGGHNLADSADFNGDGRSDILWSNANGDTAIWTATGSGGFTNADLGLIPTSWQVVGTGDFKGTGNADLVWRNSNGDTNIWYANGSGGFTSSDLGIIPTNWQLSGTGDFSGDGLADVLWRNSNGDTNVWYSNGSGGFSSTDLGIVPTNWQIVGSGDFTGTGTDDIIWRNTANGDTNIWEPTGSGGFTSVDLGIVPTSWQIAGTGDFTGTGTDDILWRNTTNGDTAVWKPTGSGNFTSTDLGIVSTSWQIAGLGDFNGNGTSDILWHNTTNGDTNIWSSNGSGGFTGADLGIVPTSWTVKAA